MKGKDGDIRQAVWNKWPGARFEMGSERAAYGLEPGGDGVSVAIGLPDEQGAIWYGGGSHGRYIENWLTPDGVLMAFWDEESA